MADGIKKYTIEINGIKESISDIDTLKESLKSLEERIIAISSKAVNISTNSSSTSTGGGSKSSSTSSLSEEEKLERQIAQLEEKRIAYQKEIYQNYLAAKDVLKETTNDQKALAAQERLAANTYSNTMQGMKQELADIKQAMQTIDLGDGEQFTQMTQRANELNNKLKEIEESYGQFGRNVGNYATAADGFKNIVIQVNGVDREFANAKEASRELGNELKTMAVNGQQGTKEFKELQKVVAALNSDIKDATVSSKAMDNLLDTMQSFAAIGNITAGFSALFGFDDDEIQKSIQKLMALQNVLKGIESINQQMNTGEGIGGWISKGNKALDSFIAKLTGAKVAQEGLNTATNAGETATVAATTATEAQTVAQNAQTDATNKTTIATKALKAGLMSLGIGLVIIAVATLITYWKDIVGWFENTIPVLKNLGTWFNKLTAVLAGVGTALVKWIIAPFKLAVDVISAVLEGRFADLPKVVGKSLKDSYDVIENYQKGHNKAIENQQAEHNKKMRDKQLKANEEAEKDAEAKYGKDYARTQKHYRDQLALFDKQLASVKKGSDEYNKIQEKRAETQRQLWASERSQREEEQKKAEQTQKKAADAAKKNAKEIADAEKDLNALKIANMKEGLNKTLKQLEEERRAKLAKIRADGILVGERELEINILYDRKIEEEKKKHAEEVSKIYDEMNANILAKQIEAQRKQVEIDKSHQTQLQSNFQSAGNKYFNQGISSYGIQGKTQYSPETQEKLGIISTAKNDEMVDDYKKLIEIQREYQLSINALKAAKLKQTNEISNADNKLQMVEQETNEKLKQLEWDKAFMWDEEYERKKYDIEKILDQEKLKVERLKEHWNLEISLSQMAQDAKEKVYDDFNKSLQQKYSTEEDQARAKYVQQALLDENYTKNLSITFQQRLTAVEAYWLARTTDEKAFAEKLYQDELALAKNAKQQEINAENDSWNKQVQLQSDWAKKSKEALEAQAKEEKWTKEELEVNLSNIDKKYDKAARELLQAHTDVLLKIDETYANKEKELLNKKNEDIKKQNAEYYQDSLQEFRDFQTALNDLESKQPVMNAWGIVNLKQTNKNNRELLDSYDELARQISMKRKQLNSDFSNGLIDKDIYQSSLREMDSFEAGLGEKMDAVKHALSFAGQWEQLSQGINQWVQVVGQAISSVMSSLSEITNNQYEAQISQQEKYIEEYQKLLDKQKEATQKYSNDVNSIEDELKTARGDRRQQLIDNLNATIAAQRASLAQEKKIEKEQQKAEEKKKKLEHDQAVAKKNMDVAQAYINAAMAVSMAAVNKWPIPAIPMMALAAAVGAAQIAAVKSQNIPSYGTGGIIQGKSHAQGGVKVLGGTAEVEGGEFITNKVTTSQNVELLEYVNSKRKRIDLSDMVEFYGGNSKVMKNVQQVRTKFADGGVLPSLRTDITFNDRLLQSFEDYSNRPVVVSVQEIVDVNNGLNRVKVLSGLESSSI